MSQQRPNSRGGGNRDSSGYFPGKQDGFVQNSNRGTGRGNFQRNQDRNAQNSNRGTGRGNFQRNQDRTAQNSNQNTNHGQSNQRQPISLPQSERYEPIFAQSLKSGTQGNAVELMGNFYQLLTTSIITVFHYQLNVSHVYPNDNPAKSSNNNNNNREDDDARKRQSTEKFFQKFTKEIVEKFFQVNREIVSNKIGYVYSGLSNFYTNQALPVEQENFIKEFTIVVDGNVEKHVRIEPELVDQFVLDPKLVFHQSKLENNSEKILTFYDILFGYLIAKHYQPFQRKYFDLGTSRPLQGSWPYLESVVGFMCSVRRTLFGLALNLQPQSACKLSGQFKMLPELIKAIICAESNDRRDLNRLNIDNFVTEPRVLAKVNGMIRHLRVFTTHTGYQRSYLIDRILTKTPAQQTFDCNKTGKTISIEDYFLQEYNIRPKALPLVQTVGGRVSIPLELCQLCDNQFLTHTKLNSNVQSQLLFRATLRPEQYFAKLQQIVESIANMGQTGVDEIFQKFALKLIPKPAQFTGRILPVPRLVPGKKQLVSTPSPTKQLSMVMICFYDSLHRNTIDESKLKNFADSLKESLISLKFKIGPINVQCIPIQRPADMEKEFAKILKNGKNPDMFLIGIQENDSNPEWKMQYNLIKHFTDQKFQFVSQCFDLFKVIPDIPRGYLENLALKINKKLDGQNSQIDWKCLKEKLPTIDMSRTMVAGIDVNHPAPTEKLDLSIACAVGSYDNQFSKYTTRCRAQEHDRQEVVTQLETMFDELLEEYYRQNQNKYPANVVVFRDGVSEGQFQFIKDVEIPLIQKSIDKLKANKLGPGGTIKLIVLVVQKRHHVRFIRTKQDMESYKPSYNVSSGTVVDQSIVDPNWPMFFINSHNPLLGTSKSTKYVLLRDDLRLSTDHLQLLCYYSCFNCARTRNAISIPTAIRYADLCAYRSKLHLLAQFELESKQMMVAYADRNQTEQQQINAKIEKCNKMIKMNSDHKNQHYYC